MRFLFYTFTNMNKILNCFQHNLKGLIKLFSAKLLGYRFLFTWILLWLRPLLLEANIILIINSWLFWLNGRNHVNECTSRLSPFSFLFRLHKCNSFWSHVRCCILSVCLVSGCIGWLEIVLLFNFNVAERHILLLSSTLPYWVL